MPTAMISSAFRMTNIKGCDTNFNVCANCFYSPFHPKDNCVTRSIWFKVIPKKLFFENCFQNRSKQTQTLPKTITHFLFSTPQGSSVVPCTTLINDGKA